MNEAPRTGNSIAMQQMRGEVFRLSEEHLSLMAALERLETRVRELEARPVWIPHEGITR